MQFAAAKLRFFLLLNKFSMPFLLVPKFFNSVLWAVVVAFCYICSWWNKSCSFADYEETLPYIIIVCRRHFGGGKVGRGASWCRQHCQGLQFAWWAAQRDFCHHSFWCGQLGGFGFAEAGEGGAAGVSCSFKNVGSPTVWFGSAVVYFLFWCFIFKWFCTNGCPCFTPILCCGVETHCLLAFCDCFLFWPVWAKYDFFRLLTIVL